MEKKFDLSLFYQFLYFVSSCFIGSNYSIDILRHGFKIERIMGLMEKNIIVITDSTLPHLASRAATVWYNYLTDFNSKISPRLLDFLKEWLGKIRGYDAWFIEFYFNKDPRSCISKFQESVQSDRYYSRELHFRSYNQLPINEISYEEYKKFSLELLRAREKNFALDYFRLSKEGYNYIWDKVSNFIECFSYKNTRNSLKRWDNSRND